ncbi:MULTISPECIES: hypothetical protein [Lysinibacillus]|nr:MULTISPECIES: hypothetical protein [Lysinibacillus]MCS1382019.1 hypothetical protein [Lysinibacillus sphaericus]
MSVGNHFNFVHAVCSESIIFPGNVGTINTLKEVIEVLEGEIK